jgi:hypothetical protein
MPPRKITELKNSGSFRVGISFQACGKYRGQWDKLSLINIRVSQRDKGVAKKIIRILNG